MPVDECKCTPLERALARVLHELSPFRHGACQFCGVEESWHDRVEHKDDCSWDIVWEAWVHDRFGSDCTVPGTVLSAGSKEAR
jgi:hypothetical protein